MTAALSRPARWIVPRGPTWLPIPIACAVMAGSVVLAQSDARPFLLLAVGAVLALLLGSTVALAQSLVDGNERLRRDVARRERVERELRDTQEALERAQATAHLGSWQRDVASDRAHWSKETYRILGVPLDGSGPLDYDGVLGRVHPDDREMVRNAMDATMREGLPLCVHFRAVRPDATTRIVLAQAALERGADGRPLRVHGTMLDVTEQRLAAEAVERSERLLNLVLETLPVGLIVTDSTGRPIRMNPAAAQIWGDTAPLDAPPREYRAWFAGTGARVGANDWTLLRALRSGAPILGEVIDIETFDGARKAITNSAVPIRDRQGLLVGGLVVEEDITARRRAELALAERTRELERSNHELEQFAYVASHDLQEPLRMISSYTQLLGKRYAAHLDDDAREFIGYAVDGAQRMQRLISALLAYSRVGSRSAPMRPTDPNAALGAALANLEIAVRDAHAVVERDDLPAVRADQEQLVQLFQNLVGNAIKFRGDATPRIRIGAEPDGGMVRFAVADNGIGIDPVHAERIFVLFQRLHARDRYPGTGIGLAVCKKIVQRHGGRIWVESRPGAGATFCFTLPADGNDARADARMECAA